jgi:hypothetical protein
MRFKLRTVAVSTSALMVIGGAAAAYLNANSVTGSGTVSTTTNTYALELSVHESGVNPFATSPVLLPITARNPSLTTSVRIRPGAIAAPTLSTSQPVGSPPCPAASFTVAAPVSYQDVTIQPEFTEIVAYLPVTFHNLAQSQNGCLGATLAFIFPTQSV